MPSMLRSFSKKIAVIITLLIALLYGAACIAWYMPPGTYWYIALLGVGYAFLLFIQVALIVFWTVFRSKWLLLPLLSLIVSWKSVNAFFAFNPMARTTVTKPDRSFRVMQWNVMRFDQMRSDRPKALSKRKQILSYIKIQDPDILCMQEFFESNKPERFAQNIPYFKDSLGFSYFYYAMDHRRPDTAYEHGIAIFSKFPIKKAYRGKFNGPKDKKANESYIYVDLDVNGQPIRVLTTHLQSLLFSRQEYEKLESLKRVDDSALISSIDISRKFRQAYRFRQEQAEIIRGELDKSPYPALVAGDFNDVPHSFVYHMVKGPFQDVFTEKGFGMGRSFSSISPTLRIDYILADKRFDVIQCRNPHPDLSDHFPVIADFRIPIDSARLK